MLNAEAILDQKQAPGLIENPCRDALIDLAQQVPTGQCIVELGSFKGRSTGHLALGSHRGNKVPVYAVDPWEGGHVPRGYEQHAPTVSEYRLSETRQVFETHMQNTGAHHYVTAIQATAKDAAKNWNGPKIGLLFHDALHRLEDVRDDLRAWLPHMANKAVIVLHDVGDPTFQVLSGAEAAFTRNKQLRETWNWEGREIHLWQKPDGNGGWRVVPKRGYAIIRTKE